MSEHEDQESVHVTSVTKPAKTPAKKPAAPAKAPAKRRGKTPPQNTAKTINIAQRRRDAVELRKAGATFDRIAEALGYNDGQAARRDVNKFVKDQGQDTKDEMTRLVMEQFGHQEMLLWRRMQKGDLAAFDRWFKLKQEIIKLYGLSAPQQMAVDLNHSGAIDKEAVLVIEGDEASYVAALRRAIGFPEGGGQQ